MATNYWKGGAAAVAQVATVEITGYDAGTTYKLTVGGIVVSVVGSGGTPTTVATALAAAWNASTHPYIAAVTAAPNAAVITLTADTAGVPFTATASVTGAAGTIGAVTAVTAASGPNDYSTAANWSLGAVPVATNDVVFENYDDDICWGLDQSAVQLHTLRIDKTFTGRIGLDRTQFATSSNGRTFSTTSVPEYRGDYLQVDVEDAHACTIGENLSASSAAGSQRIKLNFGASAVIVTIISAASSSVDASLPAIRFKFNSATAALYVRSAAGGVGIAVDVPGETSTIGSVTISDTTSTSRVFFGAGVSPTTYLQEGGNNVLQSAATVTAVTANSGTLRIEGDFTITTLTVAGDAVVYDNHIKTAGNANTAVALNGGTLDATQSSVARTWAALAIAPGAELDSDPSVLTITALTRTAARQKLTAEAL
jgi:hypothetical protein